MSKLNPMLPLVLGWYNNQSKLQHLQGDCCELKCIYAPCVPLGTILPTQMLFSPDWGTVQSIEVLNELGDVVETLDTGRAVTIKDRNNLFALILDGKMPLVPCGNHQFKVSFTASDQCMFSDYFKVVASDCCLHLIEWSNDCNVSGICYEGTNYTNKFYIPIGCLTCVGTPVIEEDISITGTDQKEFYIQDDWTFKVGPVYPHVLKVLQTIGGHSNKRFTKHDGETTEMLSFAPPVGTPILNTDCLIEVQGTFRQSNFFDADCCGDDGLENYVDCIPAPLVEDCVKPCQPVCDSINAVAELLPDNTATISLSWAGSSAIGYRIKHRIKAVDDEPVNTWETSSVIQSTVYDIVGLELCKDYDICVQSFCDEALTNMAQCTICVSTPSISCEAPTADQIAVTVTETTALITVSQDCEAEYMLRSLLPDWTNATPFTGSINDLIPCTNYAYRLRCKCEDPCSDEAIFSSWLVGGFTTDCCTIEIDTSVEYGECGTQPILTATAINEINYTIDVNGTTATNGPLTIALDPGTYQITATNEVCTTIVPIIIDDPCTTTTGVTPCCEDFNFQALIGSCRPPEECTMGGTNADGERFVTLQFDQVIGCDLINATIRLDGPNGSITNTFDVVITNGVGQAAVGYYAPGTYFVKLEYCGCEIEKEIIIDPCDEEPGCELEMTQDVVIDCDDNSAELTLTFTGYGTNTTLDIYSDGFGPFTVPIDSNGQTISSVTLGDSFTVRACLPDDPECCTEEITITVPTCPLDCIGLSPFTNAVCEDGEVITAIGILWNGNTPVSALDVSVNGAPATSITVVNPSSSVPYFILNLQPNTSYTIEACLPGRGCCTEITFVSEDCPCDCPIDINYVDCNTVEGLCPTEPIVYKIEKIVESEEWSISGTGDINNWLSLSGCTNISYITKLDLYDQSDNFVSTLMPLGSNWTEVIPASISNIVVIMNIKATCSGHNLCFGKKFRIYQSSFTDIREIEMSCIDKSSGACFTIEAIPCEGATITSAGWVDDPIDEVSGVNYEYCLPPCNGFGVSSFDEFSNNGGGLMSISSSGSVFTFRVDYASPMPAADLAKIQDIYDNNNLGILSNTGTFSGVFWYKPSIISFVNDVNFIEWSMDRSIPICCLAVENHITNVLWPFVDDIISDLGGLPINSEPTTAISDISSSEIPYADCTPSKHFVVEYTKDSCEYRTWVKLQINDINSPCSNWEITDEEGNPTESSPTCECEITASVNCVSDSGTCFTAAVDACVGGKILGTYWTDDQNNLCSETVLSNNFIVTRVIIDGSIIPISGLDYALYSGNDPSNSLISAQGIFDLYNNCTGNYFCIPGFTGEPNGFCFYKPAMTNVQLLLIQPSVGSPSFVTSFAFNYDGTNTGVEGCPLSTGLPNIEDADGSDLFSQFLYECKLIEKIQNSLEYCLTGDEVDGDCKYLVVQYEDLCGEAQETYFKLTLTDASDPCSNYRFEDSNGVVIYEIVNGTVIT